MPIPAQTRTLNRLTARDEAYELLRNWIIDGTLEPGEQIRDVDLAESLGLSRMPVREALLRLVGEGLIEVSANRWTRVAPLDLSQAKHLYPIVWSLESLAVSLLVLPIRPDALNAMREANARLQSALERGDGPAASVADAAFHWAYVAEAENPEISRTLGDVKNRLQRLENAYFRVVSGAERALIEHQAIIDALVAGDRAAAEHAVLENWRNSLHRLEGNR